MSITFVALLNLIEFADLEISGKATKIADYLLTMLAKHTFDGVVVGPMGRVYKDVLYPFTQGAQALLNLIDSKAPYQFSEGWLGLYATSSYKIPKNLIDIMHQSTKETYTSENDHIHLNKQTNY